MKKLFDSVLDKSMKRELTKISACFFIVVVYNRII